MELKKLYNDYLKMKEQGRMTVLPYGSDYITFDQDALDVNRLCGYKIDTTHGMSAVVLKGIARRYWTNDILNNGHDLEVVQKYNL